MHTKGNRWTNTVIYTHDTKVARLYSQAAMTRVTSAGAGSYRGLQKWYVVVHSDRVFTTLLKHHNHY